MRITLSFKPTNFRFTALSALFHSVYLLAGGMPAVALADNAAAALPARLYGVDVADLPAPLQSQVMGLLSRESGSLDLQEIKSVTVHELHDGKVVLDVTGRGEGFKKVSSRIGADGGLGMVRIEASTDPESTEPVREIMRKSVADMQLQVTVSLSDQVMVVQDGATGYRRVYPVGVGAIAKLQGKSKVPLSFTETSDAFRLLPQHVYSKMGGIFKNKPFLSFGLPEGGSYRPSQQGFHIWQDENGGFVRGFVSHGCVHLRDADLDELHLTTLSTQAKNPMMLTVQVAPIDGVEHPFPKETRAFKRSPNYRPQVDSRTDLWKLEWAKAPAPTAEQLVGAMPFENAASIAEVDATGGEVPVAAAKPPVLTRPVGPVSAPPLLPEACADQVTDLRNSLYKNARHMIRVVRAGGYTSTITHFVDAIRVALESDIESARSNPLAWLKPYIGDLRRDRELAALQSSTAQYANQLAWVQKKYIDLDRLEEVCLSSKKGAPSPDGELLTEETITPPVVEKVETGVLLGD